MSTSNVPNLMNTMMELRKCCNHPFLINGAEEKIVGEYHANSSGENREAIHLTSLIEASGKLVLIDKLLPKLKAGGHKVGLARSGLLSNYTNRILVLCTRVKVMFVVLL